MLVDFLRTSKPSTLPEARRLAVEGLSILGGDEALDALIHVASENLADLSDPVVRLAEETVVSRAAGSLAGFSDPRALQTLLKMLEHTHVQGVAEAFEIRRDPRAIPYLISWLEDDFVADAAARAISAYGRLALPSLLDSLCRKTTRHGVETRMSERRRARILEVLAESTVQDEDLRPVEDALEDPVEAVRLSAVRAVLVHGNVGQQRRAFRIGLQLLDSSDRGIRWDCEEILFEHFLVGPDLVEHQIGQRRTAGESECEFFPKETTLTILMRIDRKGKQTTGAR